MELPENTRMEKQLKAANKMLPQLEAAAKDEPRDVSSVVSRIRLFVTAAKLVVPVAYYGAVGVDKLGNIVDRLLGKKSGESINWKNLNLGAAAKRLKQASTNAVEQLGKLKADVENIVKLDVQLEQKLKEFQQLEKKGEKNKATQVLVEMHTLLKEMLKPIDEGWIIIQNLHKEAQFIVQNKDGYQRLGEVKEAMDKISDKKYVEIQDLKYMVFKATPDVPVQYLNRFVAGRLFAYGDIKGPIEGINEHGEIGIKIQTGGMKDQFAGIKRFKIYPQAYFLKFEKDLVELEQEMIKARSYKRFEEGLQKLEHGNFEPVKSSNFMRVYYMFERYYAPMKIVNGQLMQAKSNTSIRTIVNSKLQGKTLVGKGILNELFEGVSIHHEFDGKGYVFVIQHFDERHVYLTLQHSNEQAMGVLLDHDLPMALDKLTLFEKKAPLDRKLKVMQDPPFGQRSVDDLIKYLVKNVNPNPKKWQLDKWGLDSQDIGVLRLVGKYRLQQRKAKVTDVHNHEITSKAA